MCRTPCQLLFYFLCVYFFLNPLYTDSREANFNMGSYNPNYFRKGLLPLLLLHLLQEKDMYGYELVKTIAARTDRMILIKEGAMYPVLYQMLEAGQVSEQRVPHKRRMTHIYYHLEEPGRQPLRLRATPS